MMTALGLRERRLGAAIIVLAFAAIGAVATALPLAVISSAGGEPPSALVDGHIALASLAIAALLVKLALLGKRARPGRARRFFASLVAQIGLVLVVYSAATGTLVLVDPAWSNQHLAASFWAAMLAATHVRQRKRRTVKLLRATQQPVGRSDAAERVAPATTI
jgi:membrane associated rhomboid family serine protease